MVTTLTVQELRNCSSTLGAQLSTAQHNFWIHFNRENYIAVMCHTKWKSEREKERERAKEIANESWFQRFDPLRHLHGFSEFNMRSAHEYYNHFLAHATTQSSSTLLPFISFTFNVDGQWCKIIRTQNKFIHVAIKSAAIFFFYIFFYFSFVVPFWFLNVTTFCCVYARARVVVWLAVRNSIKSGFLLCAHMKLNRHRVRGERNRDIEAMFTAPSCRSVYDTLGTERMKGKKKWLLPCRFHLYESADGGLHYKCFWMRSLRFLHTISTLDTNTHECAYNRSLTQKSNWKYIISKCLLHSIFDGFL